MASPTPLWQYIIGQMIGGSLRGMYAGDTYSYHLLIIFGSVVLFNLVFGIMLLNGMLFGALGVMAAIVSSTHADIARFSTFVILPMTFLCNTFFSVEQIPKAMQWIIEVLPLTHTSRLLRQLAGRVYFMDQHFNINFLYCFIHADSSLKIQKQKLVEERSVCGKHVYPFSAIVGQDAMKKIVAAEYY